MNSKINIRSTSNSAWCVRFEWEFFLKKNLPNMLILICGITWTISISPYRTHDLYYAGDDMIQILSDNSDCIEFVAYRFCQFNNRILFFFNFSFTSNDSNWCFDLNLLTLPWQCNAIWMKTKAILTSSICHRLIESLTIESGAWKRPILTSNYAKHLSVPMRMCWMCWMCVVVVAVIISENTSPSYIFCYFWMGGIFCWDIN